MIHSRVDRLYREIWTVVRFYKSKLWMVCSSHNNPMQLYRPGDEWLKSCMVRMLIKS